MAFSALQNEGLRAGSGAGCRADGVLPLAGGELDGHVLDAADEVRPEALHVAGEAHVSDSGRELLEDETELGPGEVRAEAEVRAAAAEADVVVGRPLDVEGERVDEGVLAEVQLGLVEYPPPPRSAAALPERSSEFVSEGRGGIDMRSGRLWSEVERAADQFGHDVRRRVEDVLIGRGPSHHASAFVHAPIIADRWGPANPGVSCGSCPPARAA